MQGRIARTHGFAFVESWPLVEPWIDKLNVDGIHWPFEVHAVIGRAVADALIPQIAGDVACPGIPGFSSPTRGGSATSCDDPAESQLRGP